MSCPASQGFLIFLIHKLLPFLPGIAARALPDTVRQRLRIHIGHVQMAQEITHPQLLPPAVRKSECKCRQDPLVINSKKRLEPAAPVNDKNSIPLPRSIHHAGHKLTRHLRICEWSIHRRHEQILFSADRQSGLQAAHGTASRESV